MKLNKLARLNLNDNLTDTNRVGTVFYGNKDSEPASGSQPEPDFGSQPEPELELDLESSSESEQEINEEEILYINRL